MPFRKLMPPFTLTGFHTRGRIIRLDELGQTFVVRLVVRL